MNKEELFLAVVSVSLLIVMLVTGILLVVASAARQRNRQHMQLAENRLAFERELRAVEAEVSEQVLKRLAQELHDNIGQLVTAARFQLEAQKLDHPGLSDKLQITALRLEQIDEQLRLLSRTLNPDFLGDNGLVSNIEAEVFRLSGQQRLRLHWQKPDGITGLDANQELLVFRIFQEVVQNALRHAAASDLYIELQGAPDFSLQVRDNGKGFDPDGIFASNRASGLRNIRRRAQLAGLQMHLESRPGQGTLFRFTGLQGTES